MISTLCMMPRESEVCTQWPGGRDGSGAIAISFVFLQPAVAFQCVRAAWHAKLHFLTYKCDRRPFNALLVEA